MDVAAVGRSNTDAAVSSRLVTIPALHDFLLPSEQGGLRGQQ